MKTQMKLCIGMAVLGLCSFGLNAQESKSESKQGEMRIKIVQDENGKKTEFDTSFTLEDKEKIEAILKEKGIDWKESEEMERAFQLKVDEMEPGQNKFIIRMDEEDQGGENTFIRVIKMDDGDGSAEMDREIEVLVSKVMEEGGRMKVEELLQEDGEKHRVIRIKNGEGDESFNIKTAEDLEDLDEETRIKVKKALQEAEEIMQEQIHFEHADGKQMIIMKGDHPNDTKQIKYEFKSDEGDHKKFIVKTKVMEMDESGQLVEKEHEIVTDHAMVILIESDEAPSDSKKEINKRKVQTENLENLNIQKLKIYPNPSTGAFKIAFKSKVEQNIQLSIRDTQGLVVYEKRMNGFKGRFSEDLDLTDRAKGVYLFNLQAGDEAESRKIILN